MRILGIDPGIATTGYGIIEGSGNRLTLIEYGTILTKPDLVLPKRLNLLFSDLALIMTAFKPEAIAVEELFLNTNAKTALIVGHARGVILLAGERYGCSIFGYTPPQVKMAVTGYGHAKKDQIQAMVKTLLNLDKIPKPDDAADALAIAICHSHSHRIKSLS